MDSDRVIECVPEPLCPCVGWEERLPFNVLRMACACCGTFLLLRQLAVAVVWEAGGLICLFVAAGAARERPTDVPTDSRAQSMQAGCQAAAASGATQQLEPAALRKTALWSGREQWGCSAAVGIVRCRRPCCATPPPLPLLVCIGWVASIDTACARAQQASGRPGASRQHRTCPPGRVWSALCVTYVHCVCG